MRAQIRAWKRPCRTLMVTRKAKEKFLQAFERRFAGRADASWLINLRRSAIARFGELGFPTTRQEDWKYTSVDPIAALEFNTPEQNGVEISSQDLLALSFADEARHRLVFIDGIYSPRHSSTIDLPVGMRVQNLAQLLNRNADLIAPWLARYAGFHERPFVALNTAFMEDGAAIFVPSGCRLEEPVHVIFASTGSPRPMILHPRNLIVCGETSAVKIVETYVGLGQGAYVVNPVTEIAGGVASVIDHYRLQREGKAGFHVGMISARLERGTSLVSHNVTFGGALVRNDVHAILGGEGSECHLNGLYLTDGDQHVDNHTEIDHAQPRAASRELYKGILRGRARGVFNGKILVRKAAQKSDARQTNKNLLLSKDAIVNSKPQLEIYADDVKCSHGSSIGQLDGDALFYLRSRGIGADDARKLLSFGFAAEVLSRMKIEALRARLEDYLLTQFGKTGVLQ
jgi:Fe-S cluster assembly protein SufD